MSPMRAWTSCGGVADLVYTCWFLTSCRRPGQYEPTLSCFDVYPHLTKFLRHFWHAEPLPPFSSAFFLRSTQRLKPQARLPRLAHTPWYCAAWGLTTGSRADSELESPLLLAAQRLAGRGLKPAKPCSGWEATSCPQDLNRMSVMFHSRLKVVPAARPEVEQFPPKVEQSGDEASGCQRGDIIGLMAVHSCSKHWLISSCT